MNKGRLEAFTDAIVAIAATIMVLELKTPLTNDLEGISVVMIIRMFIYKEKRKKNDNKLSGK